MSVDVDTGEVAVEKMLGVFAVGRLLNPRLARFQLIGGMTVWAWLIARHCAGDDRSVSHFDPALDHFRSRHRGCGVGSGRARDRIGRG